MPDPIGRFGPEDLEKLLGVPRETMAKLEIYAQLLERWNRSINLVGRDSLRDLWRRHFLDSAQLMAFLPKAPTDEPLRVVDMGSGAGFPGLVLSLLGAGQVHLVESDRRKCAFLREVARSTGARVQVHPVRLEQIEDLTADVVTARALAPLDRLLDYAERLLRPQGVCLFLKGRSVEKELANLPAQHAQMIESFPSRASREGVILKIGGGSP
ncbi:MAG TPA: 16S rRNA (guanine(527)-N(7))-methyltransferase RsmG [Kiloniellales bacterium]|nr:16S rRNA (guanine(527)-N(7))-methyltransferase RsmG [Kiloniellales bacterium]